MAAAAAAPVAPAAPAASGSGQSAIHRALTDVSFTLQASRAASLHRSVGVAPHWMRHMLQISESPSHTGRDTRSIGEPDMRDDTVLTCVDATTTHLV